MRNIRQRGHPRVRERDGPESQLSQRPAARLGTGWTSGWVKTQTQDTERSPGRTGTAPLLSHGESSSKERPSWRGGHLWIRFGFGVPQKDLCSFSHFSNYLPQFCLSSCYSVWTVIEEPVRYQERGRVWAVTLAPGSGHQVLVEGPPRGQRGPTLGVSGQVFCRCSADWLITLSHVLEMG